MRAQAAKDEEEVKKRGDLSNPFLLPIFVLYWLI